MKKFFFLLTFIFFITNPVIANNIATVDIQLIMNTSVAGIDLKKQVSSIEKKKIPLWPLWHSVPASAALA